MVQQDRQEPTGSGPTVRPAAARTRTVYDSKEGIPSSNAQSPGTAEVTSFRLTPPGLRRYLDQDSDDECTSPVSAEPQSGTRLKSSTPPVPTESQRKSHLEPGTPIPISHRSSLDARLSFTPDSEPSPVEHPTPWLAFLDSEIQSTTSSGEHHTHRLLLILKKYFSSPSPTQDDARRTAEDLDAANEDFLLGSWAVSEHREEEDTHAFLWLLWGALLEIALLMDYRDDSHASIVMLVEELLQGREKVIEVPGKWKALEVPGFHSIWPTAYVGYRPNIRPVRPLQSTQQDWITCYSLLGRLTGAGLADIWAPEVWALDDALGDDSLENPGLECTVLAAAEYVKHAGERLAVTGAETRGWVRSLSLRKWRVWMDRFAVIADLVDDGPVKGAAQGAHDFMLTVAVEVGFVVGDDIHEGRLGVRAAENCM